MVIEFVKSWYYTSHDLAQASILWGTVAHVSDLAHGHFVIIYSSHWQQDWFCKLLENISRKKKTIFNFLDVGILKLRVFHLKKKNKA